MNQRISNRIICCLFVLPALFFYTLCTYYPLIASIRLSFTNWDGFDPNIQYIGFKNYQQLIKFPNLLRAVTNTAKFAIFTTFFQNLLQLLLALALDRKMRTRGFIRASFFMPCLFSMVVISAIFTYILQYDGVLNNILRVAGLGFLENDWFGNKDTALELIMAINIWQWTGFGSVIYLAGLQSIPGDYYEAADIDGVSAWGKFRYITFPLLMPAITIMTFIALSGGMRLFEMPYIITHGGPAGATQTIGTFIIQQNAVGRVALACTVSVVLMALTVILAVIQLRITRSREVEA